MFIQLHIENLKFLKNERSQNKNSKQNKNIVRRIMTK